MKKFFILSALFIFSICFNANATHLMGGDMTIQLDSGGSSYTLKLSLYRDIHGIPLVTSATVEEFIYNSTTGQYVHATTFSIPENTALSTSLLPSFPYGVEVGIYTATIPASSLSTNKYEFVYTECCRNNAIANMTSPGSQNFVVGTDFEVFSSAANSTPECLTMPLAYFPINVPAYYNPLPYDADGDSLAWSLNTPVGTVAYTSTTSPVCTIVPGFTTPPSTTSGTFSMNSYTGEITWTPNTLGNFVQSFIIDEYRSGTKIGSIIRDMQYVIIPDTSSDSLWCSAMTTTMHDGGENSTYIYYTPGKELTYTLRGNCLRASDLLTLNAYGGPFTMTSPATFNSVRAGTYITGTMKWTPPAGLTKDIITVFRLTGGIFSTDQTLVLRRDPHSTAVAPVQGNEHTVAVYPNPAHNTINISLSLTEGINGDISLYSVLGQKVQTIYTGSLPKGSHQLTDNITVAPGMYFIIVKDNGNIINTQHVVIQ